MVAVCHHDTPSGTINPVAEIGRIVAAHGAYLSGRCGVLVRRHGCRSRLLSRRPVRHRAEQVPGLSAGPFARRRDAARLGEDEGQPECAARFDPELSRLGARLAPGPAVPVHALGRRKSTGWMRRSICTSSEGPERVWARHAVTAAACRAGVLAMGLRSGPADIRTASPTTTAVRIPAGIEDAALRALARARYGVMFSSGRGETLGKLVRIGHMGPTARPLYAVVAADRARRRDCARSGLRSMWRRESRPPSRSSIAASGLSAAD